MVAALGVYASLSRELGEPLHFPGGGHFVTEATDARLLARAIEWAGRTPACAGETFNVTNGDVLEWRSLWAAMADFFGLELGEERPQRLAETMPVHADVWRAMADRHRLVQPDMGTLVGSSWQFADAVLGAGGGQTTLLSTIKIRQFGFGDCVDTEDMLLGYLAELRSSRVLPA